MNEAVVVQGRRLEPVDVYRTRELIAGIPDWSRRRLSTDWEQRYGHGIVIPRQQMVQWAEHIATWLLPICDAMWQAMLANRYLQIDETPVKVLDPDVKGKVPRGYLRFYAVPGGDVILGLVPWPRKLE